MVESERESYHNVVEREGEDQRAKLKHENFVGFIS
jgi:hypothetical protein